MIEIGLIEAERLRKIPRKNRAQHEFCFHLHDLMAQLLLQMEAQNAAEITIKFESAEDRRLFDSGSDIFDGLEKTGRTDLARRAIINHCCLALYADMLHFIYEGLRALEKGKFTVAFTLLRKPLKEGMLIAAQMCADESAFFDKLKTSPKDLLNRRELDPCGIKTLLENAIETCDGRGFIDAEKIFSEIFDRGYDAGLSGLFDKATHLVTGFKKIETENYNLNFIFKNPYDKDVYEGGTYALLAMVLLFLNLMQIQLYSRMRQQSKKYQNWILFTSIGAYEALFTSGRPRIAAFVNKHFGDFMECPICQAPLKVTKATAPRFFIGERIDCDNCSTSQHFPFGWLLSQSDLDLFNDVQTAKQ